VIFTHTSPALLSKKADYAEKESEKNRCFLSLSLSCKKDIDSRAISRNRKSSNKEGEQIFKA